MKNINIRYFKGHLIDIETDKPVHLKTGETYALQGDDFAFSTSDPLNSAPEILTAEEKAEAINKTNTNNKMIIASGTRFQFRVGLGKNTKDEQHKEFWFGGELLEDLYLVLSKNEKVQFAPCHCLVDEVISGSLIIPEKVYGASLNNLFSNVVTYFFPFQRSAAANAFKTYEFEKHDLIKQKIKFKAVLKAKELLKKMEDI
jgi:hypothetical protein